MYSDGHRLSTRNPAKIPAPGDGGVKPNFGYQFRWPNTNIATGLPSPPKLESEGNSVEDAHSEILRDTRQRGRILAGILRMQYGPC